MARQAPEVEPRVETDPGVGRRRTAQGGRNYCQRNAVTLSLLCGIVRRRRRLYWPPRSVGWTECAFVRLAGWPLCRVDKLTLMYGPTLGRSSWNVPTTTDHWSACTDQWSVCPQRRRRRRWLMRLSGDELYIYNFIRQQ